MFSTIWWMRALIFFVSLPRKQEAFMDRLCGMLVSVAVLWLGAAGPLSAAAPTVIASCPATISSPGYYATESELSATGDCITIKASNVTLALYETIDGDSSGKGTGITIAKGATGVVIRGHGSVVRYFQNGIVDQGGGASIGGLSLENNTTGLLLAGASSNPTLVDNVESSSNGIGVHVTSAAGIRINGLQMYYNTDHGLWLDKSSQNSVTIGFTAYQNAMQVEIDSSGNTVGTCELDYGQYGIVIKKGAGDNLVADCGYDTGADAAVSDALDHNRACGSNFWIANSFSTGSPKCVLKTYPHGMTVLTACQSIDASGFYFVKGNLKASGDCFVVDAPNVMLFSKFHTVTGAGAGTGLHVMPNATGFRSGGLAFKKFATGMEIDADGALLEGNDAINNRDTGILVNGATGVTVGQNDTDDNRRYGYHLLNASAAMIHNYGAFSNGIYGVFVENSNGNLFDQFNAGDNGANGIAGVYIGCSTKGPTGGCESESSLRNVVTSGSAYNNTKYGFVIDGHSDQNVMATLYAGGNGIDDVYDANRNCAGNVWWLDTFNTSNNAACMNQQ
jgi:hypothetical protein